MGEETSIFNSKFKELIEEIESRLSWYKDVVSKDILLQEIYNAVYDNVNPDDENELAGLLNRFVQMV